MSGEDQSLHGKQQRLDPQDHGMHQPDRVHHMQEHPARGTYIRCLKRVVIVGVGVGDAAAARRKAFELTRKERFHKDGESSRLRHLLDIDELIGRAKLASGYDVLNLCHDHRNDRERLCGAGDLADHADFHHLRLDLRETRDERDPPSFGGNEDAGGAQHRVDDVASPQRELLDGASDAGTHEGLVQLDLRLL